MFCKNCGKELIGIPEICLGCGARPLAGSNFCQVCGASANPLAEICIQCGSRLKKEAQKGRSGVLTAGGVLSIICGAIGVLGGILVAAAWRTEWLGIEDYYWWVVAAGLVSIPVGIMAIVGGVYALKREHFILAVIGGTCAFLASIDSFFSFFFIAPVGIAALVLIAMSRNEFQ
jgi:hypothetical protein